MFEFTISISQHYRIFDKLYVSLENKLKCVDALIVRHKFGKKYSICIACSNKFAKMGKAIIEESLINFIIFDYKKLFFENALSKFVSIKDYIEKLVSALIHFESDIDKLLVVENLDNHANEIVVDSLITFRLASLIDRWNDILKIIISNIEMLIANNSIGELLKYFEQNNSNDIELHLTENNIKICTKTKDNDLIFDYSEQDLQNVVVELISLSPDKIIVFDKHGKCESLKKNLPEYLVQKMVDSNLQ